MPESAVPNPSTPSHGDGPRPLGGQRSNSRCACRDAAAKRPAQNAFGRMPARSHWEREGKLKTPQFLSRTAAQHFVGARSDATRPKQSGLAEVRAALPCRRAAVNRAARNSKFFHAVPGGRPPAQAGRRGNSHRPCRPVTAKCCALKRAVGAVPPPSGSGTENFEQHIFRPVLWVLRFVGAAIRTRLAGRPQNAASPNRVGVTASRILRRPLCAVP